MYDVAIIGGGPAGATLARLIGQRYKTLVIEKRQLLSEKLETTLVKSCGGLLAPAAQAMLARHSLALPKDVLVGPQLFVVRTIDLDQSTETYYQRHYLNLDRTAFDHWLITLIPGSVDLRCGCIYRSLQPENGRYKIRFTRGDQEYVETARIIVSADGASSLLRRQLFPNHPFPRFYVAIQEWFESKATLPYFSAVFDSSLTDFYCWTIPKENQLIVGGAFIFGDQALPKFQLLKEKLAYYGFDLSKSIKKEGAWIARPLSLKQIFTAQNGICMIGEAAGWISPSSAEGLSYAFKSAQLLSESLEADDFEQLYTQKCQQLRLNILLKNWKAPFMYQPKLRNLVMRSGIKSLSLLNQPSF